MDDAEKALAIAPYSTKARIAKAEALYSMGQFEKVDKISYSSLIEEINNFRL